jgi:uncharacterized membrane protein (UPF0136 family)
MLQFYYYLFGIISIIGGVLGFARAKSLPSLIAGSVSGALLIIAGLLGKTVPSYTLALLVSVLLLSHFGRSYAIKKKAMPAIPMIILSLICIVVTVASWLIK